MKRSKQPVCDWCGKSVARFNLPTIVDGKTYCGDCPIEHEHPNGTKHSHPGRPHFRIGGQEIDGYLPTGTNHEHRTLKLGIG